MDWLKRDMFDLSPVLAKIFLNLSSPLVVRVSHLVVAFGVTHRQQNLQLRMYVKVAVCNVLTNMKNFVNCAFNSTLLSEKFNRDGNI